MQVVNIPQKPKYLEIDEKTARITIEGCYPGYGTTLGNALRRVLLSSLSGAAINSVKIAGIKHEFSTIPGVMEDIIQVILNLKQIRFKKHTDEPISVSLKVKGEKEVKAGMIKCSSDIEVVNKDAHIATITSSKGEVDIEMEVRSGIGYVPVEQQEREKKEVGVIAVDAIYTPIKRVNYEIENMRVGKRTDFERIALEISTDGSITPKEAFSKAVEILVEQFSVLNDISEESGVQEEKEEEFLDQEKVSKEESEKDNENDLKKISVGNLKGIATRTLNVLEKNQVKNLEEILKYTEEEIGNLEGMGAKGIKEIKKAIGEHGFNLRKE